jgi:hypothetical protein
MADAATRRIREQNRPLCDSLKPDWGAVDSAIDGACDPLLCSTILFPASLMPKKDIVVSSRQSMRTPFWPDLEGEAMIFEDFVWCAGCAIGPPLICRSWVSEASAILPPANPWDWLFAMPVESDNSSLSVFSQVGKGVVIASQTLQDDQQLAPF